MFLVSGFGMSGFGIRAAPGELESRIPQSPIPTPAWIRDFSMLSAFLTVGLLVVLEAMLSADNALVMAIIVLSLPRHQQKKALRQGLNLFRVLWVKLIGGLYLLYLAYSHFW
jgi:predicted tellurium resistance membrane protein TerC